jgi:hypothetical protein
MNLDERSSRVEGEERVRALRSTLANRGLAGERPLEAQGTLVVVRIISIPPHDKLPIAP